MSKTLTTISVVITILVGVGTLIGFAKHFLPHPIAAGAAIARNPTERTFSGVVRRDNGQPISQAHVLAAFDQEVPQLAYSDSNGIFHFQVPSEAKTLRIEITANGFQLKIVDANLHRTGTEEIVLEPLAPMVKQSESTVERPSEKTLSTHLRRPEPKRIDVPLATTDLAVNQQCQNGPCVDIVDLNKPSIAKPSGSAADRRDSAIATLRSAAPGIVRIDGYPGEEKAIQHLSDIFDAGLWTVYRGLSSSSVLVKEGGDYHQDHVVCSSKSEYKSVLLPSSRHSSDSTSELMLASPEQDSAARRALLILKTPCDGSYMPVNAYGKAVDLYIFVGFHH